jgi:polyhydroxybutyrate depolymerase
MKLRSVTRRLWVVAVAALLQSCSSSPTTPVSSVATAGSSSGASSTTTSGSTGGAATAGSSGSVAVGSGSSGSTSGGGSGTVTATSGGSGSQAESGATGGTTATPEAGSTAQDDGDVVSSPPTDGAISSDGPPTTPAPSTGCGTAPTQALQKYVQYNINVTTGLAPAYVAMYTARNYYVWLPMNYDPTRAYTTVFLGHGCGGNGMTVLPMQNASKDNAIIVGLSAVGQCFMTSAADSPEIPFFDATLAQVESSFCVDKNHVFIAGFSSGSWLANLIGCARAGIVRGQGNATGGLPPVPTCSGPIAAMLAHDVGDTANPIAGGEAARDRILKINGCSLTDTVPYDPGIAPGDKDLEGHPIACVKYLGCPAAYPVVWCPTMGQGHSDQVATGLSVPGFWNFWEALP